MKITTVLPLWPTLVNQHLDPDQLTLNTVPYKNGLNETSLFYNELTQHLTWLIITQNHFLESSFTDTMIITWVGYHQLTLRNIQSVYECTRYLKRG